MNDRIFGYTWQQIQTAQQGGRLQSHVPMTSDKPTATATEADIKLFNDKGLTYLEAQGFHGVIERLKTSGVI